MKNYKSLLLISFVITMFGIMLILPALASPVNAAQAINTATPEDNGNIYYIVKTNDTCEGIALLNNISLDDLRSQNQLELGDCDNLTIGRKLLIAIVPTAAVTVGPSPTPTSSLPTPIPPKGVGSICIYLFNDINGNAITETGETSLPGGQINITSADGSYSGTAATNSDNTASCFTDISEGEYTISVAIPEGYNATTTQNYVEILKAGDTATVNFGAQESSRVNSSAGSSGSVLLAILGGIILIVGVGFGFYAYKMTKTH
jgi:hypothetical protein